MVVDQEIKYRLKSIIFTVLFLIISTWFWFNVRPDISNSLSIKEATYDDIYVTGDTTIDFQEGKTYTFKVVNLSDTDYSYKLAITNNYLSEIKLDYNKISYAYKLEDDNYTEYYAMVLSGDLVYDLIPPHSELVYSIKTLKSEDYQDNVTGKIILTVDQDALAMK